MGFRVFLDLKFLDIPNTVRRAVRSAVKSGADMLNIHAAGGQDMARIAVAARDEAVKEHGLGVKPLLLAVTVLTSMQDTNNPILQGRAAAEVALELAQASHSAGLDGVVCSGRRRRASKPPAARTSSASPPASACPIPPPRPTTSAAS